MSETKPTLLLALENGILTGISSDDPSDFDEIDVVVCNRQVPAGEESGSIIEQLTMQDVSVPTPDGSESDVEPVQVSFAEVEESSLSVAFIVAAMNGEDDDDTSDDSDVEESDE